MMVSERPAAPPPPAQQEAPPDVTSAPPATIAPSAPNKLMPSPFLQGFDMVLVLGVIVLGFAIASFTVRNADFWQHLGAGKLIAEGKYEFGKDPFSYSTEGRNWTNSSWLYDLTIYKLHPVAGGKGVVFFKAALIALLAGLLLFIRRPGQSMWINALCVGLALLACAPRMLMDPVIMSMLFLGATMWLLMNANRFENAWSLPALIAALFALWSNCDEWFILGPLALALFSLGEFLQQRTSPAKPDEKRASLRSLTIALLVGIAACMLNPHHVGVWRLPVELQTSLSETLSRDPSFAPMFRSSAERGSIDFDGSRGGNPVNGLAFVLLILLNAVALVLGRKRLSWGLLLVNTGLLALALVRQRAIPFYAVVAAPMAAWHFGVAIQQLKERTFSRGSMQALAGMRVAVRMFLLIVGALALAASWPGWLHPLAEHRRVAWDVKADPSLEKAAKKLQQWRDEGRVPPEAHSLILHPDLAAYCAYYAPAEKNYFDLRLALHGAEANTFFNARRQLMARRPGEARSTELFDVEGFLRKEKIAFVVMTGRDRDDGISSFFKFSLDQYRDSDPPQSKWQLWDIAGRSAVFGWTLQQAMPAEWAAALRYNPVARAFAPNAAAVSDSPITPSVVSGPLTFVDKIVKRYMDVAPEMSAGAEESQLINQHQQLMYERYDRRRRGRYTAIASVLGTAPDRYISTMVLITEPMPIEFHATATLAIRAARAGIVESPTQADGYFALAESYKSPGWHGLPEEVKELVTVSSLSRYYLRLPPEQQANPSEPQPFEAARELFQMHNAKGRLDLAAEYMRRWFNGIRSSPRPSHLNEAQFQEALKAFEKDVRQMEQKVRDNENLWLNNTARLQSQFQRAMAAQQYGLFRKSLQELNAIETGDSSKLQIEQVYEIMFARISLNLIVGQAEEAEEIIRMIDERQESQRQSTQMTDLDRLQYHRVVFRELARETMLALGRFGEVIKILNSQGSEIRAAMQMMRQRTLTLKIGGKDAVFGFNEMVQLWIANSLFVRPQVGFVDAFNPFNNLQSLIEEYVNRQRALEAVHFRLGMTYLEQGNNAAAAAQFKETVATATQHQRTQTQATAQMMLDILRGKHK